MPDPRQGVFETILVLDGRPVELDAHLERLRRSLSDVYGRDLPADLGDEIGEQSRGVSRGKARVTVAPSGVTLECERLAGDLCTHTVQKSPDTGVSLRSLTISGGLGAHKWADRSLLDEAGLPPGALPLIVDADGTLLEASRANLFAARGGVLSTPRLDGRILPGVTRARVLELAAASAIPTREAHLTRPDLLAADEVFLTGSVRGIEPAASLDGEPLAGAGALAERLGAELRRAWTGAEAAAAFG